MARRLIPGAVYAHTTNYVQTAARGDVAALRQVVFVDYDTPGYVRIKGQNPHNPEQTTIVPYRQVLGPWAEIVAEFEAARARIGG